MPYAITYTNDVQALTARGLALCDQGKWSQYMQRVEIDTDNDGVIDGIRLHMPKVDTAYAPTGLASLCFIKLPLHDIISNPSDGYVGFCEDLSLTVLAYGENRGVDCPYGQIETGIGNTLHPQARALYDSVIPPSDVLDSEGNPTGEKKFTPYIEFAIGVKNGS